MTDMSLENILEDIKDNISDTENLLPEDSSLDQRVVTEDNSDSLSSLKVTDDLKDKVQKAYYLNSLYTSIAKEERVSKEIALEIFTMIPYYNNQIDCSHY